MPQFSYRAIGRDGKSHDGVIDAEGLELASRHLRAQGLTLLSALLFSGLHRIVWLIPALAVIGVILALVYEKSGSLWPAVIVHALFNSVGVVLVYLALAQDLPLA